MARPTRLAASQSSHQLATNDAFVPRRLPPSASSISLAFPHNVSVHSLLAQGSRVRSSGTWTTSSGELGFLSDTDEVEDRAIYIHEYNRLAKKARYPRPLWHGVRQLLVDDFSAEQRGDVVQSPEKRGWLHRFLRPTAGRPASQTPNTSCQLQPRPRRSVSDLAHMLHPRREPPKIVDIQDMVRLSGKSMLYLPQEYAPCCLILPTCIRATAQHLAQNVTTRGIFRIPGSVRIVGSLFNHYCYADNGGDDIAGTVRCANLPLHIPYSVHDVASTFKRLLSVLPGGILGSLALFDALVAIHSQLNGEPEFPRTKQTKVRARLIALAIGTIKSQFRRELICAVFGLLSLIGRVSEVTPREDEDGRPLPTGDLMGYSALGIVFGPLLVGDLLDQYSMKLATPSSGMLLFPLSPRGLRRDRRRAKAEGNHSDPPTVNRVLVANNMAEMLIANWRDIVRQMKCLGTHRRKDVSSVNLRTNSLRPSASDFAIKMPRDMDTTKGKSKGDGTDPDGPVWLRYGSDKSPESASGEEVSSQSLTATQDERETPAVGGMASSVAAAVHTEEQRRQGEILGGPTQVGTSKSMPALKSSDAGTLTHEGFRHVPSLGTMVPYREPPPIAQHLNRPRPLSTPSPAPQTTDEFPVMDTVHPGPATRPRGTTILYSQIQNLQRHLGAKNEEASQLRRQLEAQEDTEVGTLSEQLRAANRDLCMWKERAESAEKRVKVFERFTTRLRTIRDNIFQERQRRTDEDASSTPTPTPTRRSASDDGDGARTADDEDSGGPGLEGRRAASAQATGGERSDDGTRTEDAGVVAARLRKCLHGELQTATAHEGTLDSPPAVLSSIMGGDGASSPRGYEGMDIMGGAEKVWAVAVELLRMEDDGVV
ncbi:Rho-GTPase-activating protein 6 [Tolypocladium capitatum]|uniref:Rho-GTPase-activating protein 6 n=1 Tax=Tolypocladium capitatum TaxID=45235 RepID=A0A2K3QP62_9HYPO|nr:Rho-GTPase-activating protein 6 [Tolypocladium capitatum]